VNEKFHLWKKIPLKNSSNNCSTSKEKRNVLEAVKRSQNVFIFIEANKGYSIQLGNFCLDEKRNLNCFSQTTMLKGNLVIQYQKQFLSLF
jgi:hypothetical protein